MASKTPTSRDTSVEYWLERWEKGETGWFKPEVHPYLKEYCHLLNAKSSEILVPLCGASPDLVWLASQGWAVVGVEASEKGARSFFRSNGLPFREERGPSGHLTLTAEGELGLRMVVGDLFRLEPEALGDPPGSVWDAGALVAVSPSAREAYVAQLLRLTRPHPRVLLYAVDYDAALHPGPPHPVTEAQVERLYGEQGLGAKLLDERPEPDRLPIVQTNYFYRRRAFLIS